jgi:hypothetical protein
MLAMTAEVLALALVEVEVLMEVLMEVEVHLGWCWLAPWAVVVL